MNDSNRTLRFCRTYREATGMEFYNADDDRAFWDKAIAWAVCMGLVFVIGVAVGMRVAA